MWPTLAVAGAASLADPGMVFLADLAEQVTADVTGLVVAGAVSPADAGTKFPAVSAERVTMDVTALTEEVHVNVVGGPTCTCWGDRLSCDFWWMCGLFKMPCCTLWMVSEGIFRFRTHSPGILGGRA